jgi:hypothetical protein
MPEIDQNPTPVFDGMEDDETNFDTPEDDPAAKPASTGTASKTSTGSAMSQAANSKFAASSKSKIHSAYHFAVKTEIPDFGVSFPVLTKKIGELSEMFAELTKGIMQPKHYSKTNQGNLKNRTAAFATCVTSDAAKYYADMVPGLDMEPLHFTATVDNAKDMFASIMQASGHPADWHKHNVWGVKNSDDGTYCVTEDFVEAFVPVWFAFAQLYKNKGATSSHSKASTDLSAMLKRMEIKKA